MIKQYRVREGNTGILYLTDSEGKEERYIPDYDLDKARELLLEFQELKDVHGKSIKDNYWAEGFNWYPTMVNFLYGQVFFSYIKYKPILEQFIDNKVQFEFENKANFHRLVSLVAGRSSGSVAKKYLFNVLLRLNNWCVIRKYQGDLFFFRFSPGDFRTEKVKKALDDLRVKYIEVLAPEKKLLINNFIQRKQYYFFGGISFKSIFNCDYLIRSQDRYRNILFVRAIRSFEEMISTSISEYRRHCRALKGTKFKTFYGIDDTQTVYPILYACQKLGIKTITHQHGAAYNKKHASYVMEGIAKNDYKWFEKIIVWGKYWRNQLLTISKVYSPDMIVEGSSLFEFDYSNNDSVSSQPRNILVPYEFLTNTYKVGRYIMKFIDLGYNVSFKPRTDEELTDQLETYCLPEEYTRRLNIVYRITPEFMQTIDIVAGTMTTLVYQLLPYSKVIWVLDTEYRYLDHLVDEGLAHKVKYENLDTLDEHYFTKTKISVEDFFNPEPLEMTLRKHVLLEKETA